MKVMVLLDTENPLDFLLYEGVQVNNKYQIGGEVIQIAML
jgi:hypothetical protein